MTPAPDIAELFARARQADIVAVVGSPLYRSGRRLRGPCPLCGASKGKRADGAFSVEPEARMFKCFGCGEGGDVVRLEQRLRGGSPREAAERLVGAAPMLPTRPAPERPIPAPAAVVDDGTARAAMRIWNEALPARGSLAQAYLAQRGIVGPMAMAALERLRFHPHVWWGEDAAGIRIWLSAMVAQLRSPAGPTGGVHVTYLTAEGRKTPREPAKRMLGPQSLGASRGGVWLAGPASFGPLIVGEGIEFDAVGGDPVRDAVPHGGDPVAGRAAGGVDAGPLGPDRSGLRQPGRHTAAVHLARAGGGAVGRGGDRRRPRHEAGAGQGAQGRRRRQLPTQPRRRGAGADLRRPGRTGLAPRRGARRARDRPRARAGFQRRAAGAAEEEGGMSAPTRPALRYLGGKWKLAPEIIAHFPPHDTYVEPFGGGASVLLRKPRVRAEVYNDLDGDVVNLFRVLRDHDSAEELSRLVALTPFAREEFEDAYERPEEPIERARLLLVRSFMGFGSCSYRLDRTTGWRTGIRLTSASAARDWANYPGAIMTLASRMRGVSVERRPALDILRAYNSPETLFYVDPPYLHSTRSPKRTRTAPSNGYAHELSDADHIELLDALARMAGKVILSGYAHPLYDDRLGGWRRVSISTLADGARPRLEVLWINPAATCGADLFGAVNER